MISRALHLGLAIHEQESIVRRYIEMGLLLFGFIGRVGLCYIFVRRVHHSTTTMLYFTLKNVRVFSDTNNQCHPEQCENQA